MTAGGRQAPPSRNLQRTSRQWQEIGERLQVSRQAAHERFARIVEKPSDGVLFPAREPDHEDVLGRWACPVAWRIPRAPAGDGMSGRSGTARTATLSAASTRSPAGSVGETTWPRSRRSACSPRSRRRILDGNLPRGVSECRARRLLLERKIAAFDLIAARSTAQAARDARTQATEAFQQLVAWHRSDLDERVTVDAAGDASIEGYRFALDGRPVAELVFTAEGSPQDTGWCLCSIDAAAFEAAPGGRVALDRRSLAGRRRAT